MQTRFEIDRTPQDLEQLARASAQSPWPRQASTAKFGRGMWGWVLFVLMAILLFTLPHPAPAHRAVSSTPGTGYVSWFAGTLIGAVLGLGALMAIKARARRRRADRQLAARQPHVLELQEQGVLLSLDRVQTLWRWEAMDQVLDTPTAFLLRFPRARKWLILPKRAIADAADVAVIGEMLQSQIALAQGRLPDIAGGGAVR